MPMPRQEDSAQRFQYALLRCQAEASPDGILVVGPNNRVLSHNRRFLEVWNIPEDITATGDDTLVLAMARSRTADPEAFGARVAAIYADPDKKTHDEVPLADGRTLERYSGPIREPGGELLGRIWFFRDITERKRAEEAVREAQRRLTQVVTSSPAVLFTLAVDGLRIGGFTWISDNLQTMLGHSPEAAMEPGWWMKNIHPDDREALSANVRAQLFSQGYSTLPCRFRRADGEYRWIQGEVRLIRDAQGKPVEAVGSWSDISERKQLEFQFLQAQKMEIVGQLAGGIAHEFNNLMTVVNGYSEILLQKVTSADPSHRPLTAIKQAGERTAWLTKQLMAFSRYSVIDAQKVDLNAIVDETAKMLARLLDKDVSISTDLDPGAGCVKIDPNQLRQVLTNLAVNARDAMPNGGRLTIQSRAVALTADDLKTQPDARPGRYVKVAVTDTGCGMTEEVRSRAFEPFFTTKDVGKGTGLGLATVFGIVKQSGGLLEIASEVGKGTAVTLYLPAVDAAI